MAQSRTVTALRAAAKGQVRVELDGRAWRTLPLEAVVRAGVAAGVELHREHARRLRREVRRLEALDVATRALRRRDLPERALAERLARRGVAEPERARTVETLRRAGLVDDARFARSRAESLAGRGYGDAFIREDLARRGIAADAVEQALDALEPEPGRVAMLVRRRGATAATARFLARRGFAEDSLEQLVAAVEAAEVG